MSCGDIINGLPRKKSRKSISLETKMFVIQRLEAGERQTDVANSMNLAPSTVRTIQANSQKIKALVSSGKADLSTTVIKSMKNSLLDKTEDLVEEWIKDCLDVGNIPSQSDVIDKATSVFETLQLECGNAKQKFPPKQTWFHRFEKRCPLLQNLKIKNISQQPVFNYAGLDLPEQLRILIQCGNYPPEIVLGALAILQQHLIFNHASGSSC